MPHGVPVVLHFSAETCCSTTFLMHQAGKVARSDVVVTLGGGRATRLGVTLLPNLPSIRVGNLKVVETTFREEPIGLPERCPVLCCCNSAAQTSDRSHTPVWRREGVAVRTVLGLSLNSDDVAWVLVDAADGTVLDHDALEFDADAEIAGAAAKGAHAIARACGLELDRVRLTWTDDVARDGLRLRARLGCLGFRVVEVVPLASAMTVDLGPKATDLAQWLVPAYGAALADVDPGAPMTAPAGRRLPMSGRAARRRTVPAALGVAAAALLGVLGLSAATAPQAESGQTTVEQPVISDAGWVAVPASAAATPNPVRKVVAIPSRTEQPTTAPAPISAPMPAAVAAAPSQTSAVPAQTAATPEQTAEAPAQTAATPETVAAAETVAPAPADGVALPTPASTGQPHLTDAHLPVGPPPGPAAPATASPTTPEMTELVNVFTALP